MSKKLQLTFLTFFLLFFLSACAPDTLSQLRKTTYYGDLENQTNENITIANAFYTYNTITMQGTVTVTFTADKAFKGDAVIGEFPIHEKDIALAQACYQIGEGSDSFLWVGQISGDETRPTVYAANHGTGQGVTPNSWTKGAEYKITIPFQLKRINKNA